MPPLEPVVRTVSFIVPALNAAPTLGACLDAILAAHPAGICREVLLIDNGSSDHTPEIAQRRGVRVVRAPGLTVAALRNLGARLAEGDLLAFVDADCVIASDWIEKSLVNFADPQVGAAGSPTHVPPAATWVERVWAHHRHQGNRQRPVEWLPTENLVVRRTAFNKIGGFNETLFTCEDVDLCYRLGALYRITNDPDMSSIHLGEAKSLRLFFKKEAWRGSGNLAGFFSHHLRFSELPSVLLPLYHFVWSLALLGATGYGLASGRWFPELAGAMMLWLPSLLLAVHTGIRTRHTRDIPKLMVLYLTYAMARSLALVVGAFSAWLPARSAARASRLSAKQRPAIGGGNVRPTSQRSSGSTGRSAASAAARPGSAKASARAEPERRR